MRVFNITIRDVDCVVTVFMILDSFDVNDLTLTDSSDILKE